MAQVLLILWRRSWIALLTLATALAVAFSVLTLVPGRYDAVATAAFDPGGADPLSGGGRMEMSIMQGNMLELVTSHRVALDVVNRLKLYADPGMQVAFRRSESLGRELIEDWIADTISGGVKPDFGFQTGVLEIKYKSNNPKSGRRARERLYGCDGRRDRRHEGRDRRADSPMVRPANRQPPQRVRNRAHGARDVSGSDESRGARRVRHRGGALSSVSDELTGQRAALTSLKSRLESENTNLSSDPSDPDLQLLNSLKDKLIALQGEIETARTQLGASNPRVVMAAASMVTVKKQIADATLRVRQHLKERITNVETQIAKLEKQQEEAQKKLIAAQAQRNKFGELARDAAFRLELLNERERAMEGAKLRSKLTFALGTEAPVNDIWQRVIALGSRLP